MKGQFMLISSILAGVIIVSAASTISEVQERSFKTGEMANTVEMIEYEASKLYGGGDTISEKKRENFRKMVSQISDYRTEVKYWDRGSTTCFNVTITAPGEERFLRCIN